MTWNSHGIWYKFRWKTGVDLWREMTWNFYENPRHIFYRVLMTFGYFLGDPCHNSSYNDTKFKIRTYPVKNVTWILMEIPWHFTSSQLDLVEVWSKSTSNSMTIPCHLSRFYLFSMLDGHGFWTSSSHGISMAFANKMMGFLSDFASFSTKLP